MNFVQKPQQSIHHTPPVYLVAPHESAVPQQLFTGSLLIPYSMTNTMSQNIHQKPPPSIVPLKRGRAHTMLESHRPSMLRSRRRDDETAPPTSPTSPTWYGSYSPDIYSSSPESSRGNPDSRHVNMHYKITKYPSTSDLVGNKDGKRTSKIPVPVKSERSVKHLPMNSPPRKTSMPGFSTSSVSRKGPSRCACPTGSLSEFHSRSVSPPTPHRWTSHSDLSPSRDLNVRFHFSSDQSPTSHARGSYHEGHKDSVKERIRRRSMENKYTYAEQQQLAHHHPHKHQSAGSEPWDILKARMKQARSQELVSARVSPEQEVPFFSAYRSRTPAPLPEPAAIPEEYEPVYHTVHAGMRPPVHLTEWPQHYEDAGRPHVFHPLTSYPKSCPRAPLPRFSPRSHPASTLDSSQDTSLSRTDDSARSFHRALLGYWVRSMWWRSGRRMVVLALRPTLHLLCFALTFYSIEDDDSAIVFVHFIWLV